MKFKFLLVLFGLIVFTSMIFANANITELKDFQENYNTTINNSKIITKGSIDIFVDNIHSNQSPINIIVNHANNIFLKSVILKDIGVTGSAHFYNNVFFDLGEVVFNSTVTIKSKATVDTLSTNNLNVNSLRGNGSAFACLDAEGNLYRSLKPCVHTGNTNGK